MTDSEFAAFQAIHRNYNSIQIDDQLHLTEDPQITRYQEGSMNHSCDSSAWMDDEATLVARRDIEAEEEVTVDYALFTTQSNWMLDTRCRCGSPHCRRIITGDDWMRRCTGQISKSFFAFINRRIERLMKGRFTAANQYDAIIIGGGHNGLVAAAYLARAGRKVVARAPAHRRWGGGDGEIFPAQVHREFRTW